MKQETVAALEEYALDLMESIANEDDEKAQGVLHKRYMDVIEKLQIMEHDDREYLDKQERRRQEDEKNFATAELEDRKLKWSRVDTIVKAAIGISVPLMSILTYWAAENRIGKLEEDGRWTTDAARMNHNNVPRLPWR